MAIGHEVVLGNDNDLDGALYLAVDGLCYIGVGRVNAEMHGAWQSGQSVAEITQGRHHIA
jgi:hypothetical protein